jgi:hypothetical protein
MIEVPAGVDDYAGPSARSAQEDIPSLGVANSPRNDSAAREYLRANESTD